MYKHAKCLFYTSDWIKNNNDKKKPSENWSSYIWPVETWGTFFIIIINQKWTSGAVEEFVFVPLVTPARTSRLICFINSWVLRRFRRAASARKYGAFFKSKKKLINELNQIDKWKSSYHLIKSRLFHQLMLRV